METNQQAPEQLTNRSNGRLLEVIDIWKTIQGEGPMVGMPSVFIRLAGCNLQCPWCDTQYTQGRKTMSIDDIFQRSNALLNCSFGDGSNPPLVVITGGEPFRQNLMPLIQRLMDAGIDVQIETNGTICSEEFAAFTYGMRINSNADLLVVVSPKTPKLGSHMYRVASAWKYVLEVGSIDPVDGLPTSVLGNHLRVARPVGDAPIYVQPIDKQDPVINKLNLEAAIEVAMKFNYRLCIQTHKLIGMP